jgi:ABC-type enterochelin transport system substrate-binding protein
MRSLSFFRIAIVMSLIAVAACSKGHNAAADSATAQAKADSVHHAQGEAALKKVHDLNISRP